MNWPETIALLRQAGYTQPQIAALCGCAQSTISELATGEIKDPRHSIGQALGVLAIKAKRRLATQQARTATTSPD